MFGLDSNIIRPMEPKFYEGLRLDHDLLCNEVLFNTNHAVNQLRSTDIWRTIKVELS
jgi:hypothetical protein